MEKGNHQNIFILCIILLTVLRLNIYGQSILTLEECINTALDKNLAIINAEYNTQISKKEYHRSLTQVLPGIYAYANEYYNSGRTFSEETGIIVDNQFWSGRWGVSGSIPLFNGFQNYYSMKQHQNGVRASQEELNSARNDLISSVIRTYYQIIFSGEQIQQYKEQVLRTDRLLRKTEILFEEGQRRQTDLYRIKAQYEREKMLQMQAENNNLLARNSLAMLMHTDSISNFIFADSVPAIPDLFAEEYDSLRSDFLNNSPELKNKFYLNEISEYQLKSSRRAYLPRISLNLDITNGYTSIAANPENSSWEYPLKDQFKNNLFTQVYVSLQVPVFSGFGLKYDNSVAKIRHIQTINNYETAKLEVEHSIRQLYLSAKAAWQNYVAAQQLVDANETTYLYTEKSFNLGTANIIELTTAGNDLMESKTLCTDAKIQYIIHNKLLDLYTTGNY